MKNNRQTAVAELTSHGDDVKKLVINYCRDVRCGRTSVDWQLTRILDADDG